MFRRLELNMRSVMIRLHLLTFSLPAGCQNKIIDLYRLIRGFKSSKPLNILAEKTSRKEFKDQEQILSCEHFSKSFFHLDRKLMIRTTQGYAMQFEVSGSMLRIKGM